LFTQPYFGFARLGSNHVQKTGFMKKYLLLALLFSGLFTSAQNTPADLICKAYFKYAVNDVLMSPVASTSINFYDKSEGTATSWWWDFGDGTTSTEQNPFHTFIQPVGGPTVKLSPYRTVSLTILTAEGCKSLYSEMINIVDGTTYTNPPSCKAIFKYSQTAYDSNVGTASFRLDNYSEGDSLSYFWQFDNGKTSTEQNPTVTFDIKPDKHAVSLTVTGKNNCSDTFYETVYIYDPNITVTDPIDCYINFGYKVNYDYKTLLPALTLDFYAKDVPFVTDWLWDFGDGSTSTEKNPTHSFNLPMNRDSVLGDPNPFRKVCLTVKTSSDCTPSHCETIDLYMNTYPVVPPKECSARYKYHQTEIDSIAGKVSFEFNNYSEGDSLTYNWFFDNGITSTEKEPVVTFDMKQLPLKASLTISGKNGCSDSFGDLVNLDIPIIYPPIYSDSTKCFVAFGYTPNFTVKTYAPALVLDFYDKTWPGSVKWNWDFGDGTTSEDQNPMHIFNLPLANADGSTDQIPYRQVCLTATTATGCTETYCENIDLYQKITPPDDPTPQCHAWIKYYRPSDVGSIPEVIPYQFIDASEGNVVRRLWQFEDGTTSTEETTMVNFDFAKPTQKVSLTIFTADSCSSTWTEIIYLNDNWIPTKPVWTYHMRVTGNFPIYMSSCAGTAHAQVYMNDSIVSADNYTWSTGELGQDVKGLCPTQTYSIKAITVDGSYVSSTFIFNSDGTVVEIPTDWYLSGRLDDQLINYKNENKNITVEWHLCDGSVVYGDSIPLNSINCGGKEANVIMKDAAGNVIYTDNISIKTLATRIKPDLQVSSSAKLYPNPVKDVLNIQYSGKLLNEMQIDIYDITGKSISSRKVYDVESGQNISLNVNSLRNGLYICKMISGKQIIGLEKFVK